MASTPQLKRGSGTNQVPYGRVGEINQGYADARALLDQLDQVEPDEEYTPAYDDQEEDDLVFRPTDRPSEPVTSGMPFGPGRNSPPRNLSPRGRKEAFAKSILNNPRSSADDKAFATRILNGE